MRVEVRIHVHVEVRTHVSVACIHALVHIVYGCGTMRNEPRESSAHQAYESSHAALI
jgi:hypothetical protein